MWIKPLVESSFLCALYSNNKCVSLLSFSVCLVSIRDEKQYQKGNLYFLLQQSTATGYETNFDLNTPIQNMNPLIINKYSKS